MSRSKSQLSQRPSNELGTYLKRLRKENNLSMAEAARKLGLKYRQQLYYYEVGRTLPSGSLLTKLAQLYHVAPDEVLERAYWPQLVLLPLIAVIEPGQLSRDLIKELEKGLDDGERRDVTQYIERLLLSRGRAK